MGRTNPEARREYYLENRERIRASARERYKRNREKILRETKDVADRNRDFRKAILAQFPCLLCGEPDPDMIDWHHVNEDEKKFNIGHTSRAHSEWWDEVLKCIPVCVSCHRKIHKEKLCLLPPWRLPKISRTESRRLPDTDSTCVPEFICQASQQCCHQLNPRSLNKDSSNGKNETQVPSKKLAPGALPFTSPVKTIFVE